MRKILISLFLVISIFTAVFNTVYATDENTNNVDLPSSYDLRNDINIRVENQGQKDWCNVYADLKMLETYLQKTRGVDYNLSESYKSYSEAEYFGGWNNYKKDVNTVNSYSMSSALGKQVLESTIPNVDYSFNEANKEKFENAKLAVKTSMSLTLYKKSKEEIKNYIMNNGGVKLHMCINSKWYNRSNGAIYCPTYTPLTPTSDYNEASDEAKDLNMHSIVIIGWDDNYSRNNFNTSNKPNSDGAWLIVNSWGTDWGDNGFGWISYEDAYVIEGEMYGIESVMLPGEINAQFGYELLDSDNKGIYSIMAYIEVDDKNIKDIDGWIKTDYGNKIRLIKEFTDNVEPYTIEIESKTDGAKTTVNINIPIEFSKHHYLSEQEQMRNYIFMIMTPFVLLIFILILVYIVKKMKKDGKTDNIFYKIITGISKVIKIILITGLCLCLVALIIFVVAFFMI